MIKYQAYLMNIFQCIYTFSWLYRYPWVWMGKKLIISQEKQCFPFSFCARAFLFSWPTDWAKISRNESIVLFSLFKLATTCIAVLKITGLGVYVEWPTTTCSIPWRIFFLDFCVKILVIWIWVRVWIVNT